MSRILQDDDGFDLVSDTGEPIARVEWLELDRIEAYNFDLICLDFFSGDQSVTVSEDDQGFEDLAPQLIAHLDLEIPDWFEKAQRPSGPRFVVFDRELGY